MGIIQSQLKELSNIQLRLSSSSDRVVGDGATHPNRLLLFMSLPMPKE